MRDHLAQTLLAVFLVLQRLPITSALDSADSGDFVPSLTAGHKTEMLVHLGHESTALLLQDDNEAFAADLPEKEQARQPAAAAARSTTAGAPARGSSRGGAASTTSSSRVTASFVQQGDTAVAEAALDLDKALDVLDAFKPRGEAHVSVLSTKEKQESLLKRARLCAKQALGAGAKAAEVDLNAVDPASELARLERKVREAKSAGTGSLKKALEYSFSVTKEYFKYPGVVMDDSAVDRATMIAFDRLSKLWEILQRKRNEAEGTIAGDSGAKKGGDSLPAVAARLVASARMGGSTMLYRTLVGDADKLAFRMLREVIAPRTLRMVEVTLRSVVPHMGKERKKYQERMETARSELESLFRLTGVSARDQIAQMSRDKTRRKQIFERVRQLEEETWAVVEECESLSKATAEATIDVIDSDKADIEKDIIGKFATEEDKDPATMTMNSVPKFLRETYRAFEDNVEQARTSLQDIGVGTGAEDTTGKNSVGEGRSDSSSSFLEGGNGGASTAKRTGSNNGATTSGKSINDDSGTGDSDVGDESGLGEGEKKEKTFRERVDNVERVAKQAITLKNGLKMLQKVSTMSAEGVMATLGVEDLEKTAGLMGTALAKEKEGLRSIIEQARSYVASVQAERDNLFDIKTGLTQLGVPAPYHAFRDDVMNEYFRMGDCSMCVLDEDRALSADGFPTLCANPTMEELIKDGLENTRFQTENWCLLHCAAQSDLKLDDAAYQVPSSSKLRAGPWSCIERTTVFSEQQCQSLCELHLEPNDRTLDPLENGPSGLGKDSKPGMCRPRAEYTTDASRIQRETGDIFGPDVRVPVRWYDRLMQMHAACNHCFLRDPYLCFTDAWFEKHVVDAWVPASKKPAIQRFREQNAP